MNSCILYCVFKAFIVRVASSNVFQVWKSERHPQCLRHFWLTPIFKTDTRGAMFFWLLGKRRNSSIFVMLVQQLCKVNTSTFSNSIYDTQYTMRLDNSCMSRHIAALTFNPFYFFFPFIWHNIYWRTESRAVRALENFRPLRHRWGLSLTALYGAIETERRIGLVGRGGIWLVRWAATHSREITPPHIDKDQAKAAIWHTGQLSGPYHGIYSAFAV